MKNKNSNRQNNGDVKQAETMFRLIGHTEEAFLDECELQKNAPERKQKGRLAEYFFRQSMFKRILFVASVAYLLLLPAAHLVYDRVMPDKEKEGYYLDADSEETLRNDFYQYYFGPVLPLTTTLKNPEDLQVERDLDLNFENFDESMWARSLLVEDRYTITNTSTEDLHVTLYYPIVVDDMLSLRRLTQLPLMYRDGEEVETQWCKGAFTGKGDFYFTDLSDRSKVGVTTKNSYQDYQALLSDGSYLQKTLDMDRIEDKKVIEYTISNTRIFTKKDHSDELSTFLFVCDLDSDKTRVLIDDRFNETDETKKDLEHMYREDFEIMGMYAMNRPAHLYVIGEDIQNICCTDCEGNVLNEEDYKITRRETTLTEILFPDKSDRSADKLTYPEKLYYQCVEYVLSDDEQIYQRYYEITNLKDYIEHIDLVFYLSGEITLKPSETTMITVQSEKYGSHQSSLYWEADEDKRTDRSFVKGYDFLLQTGSNLKFDEVTSQIRNYRNIDIMAQNFGFDLKKKITQVTLSPQQEYYYLVIAHKLPDGQDRKWYEWWSLKF